MRMTLLVSVSVVLLLAGCQPGSTDAGKDSGVPYQIGARRTPRPSPFDDYARKGVPLEQQTSTMPKGTVAVFPFVNEVFSLSPDNSKLYVHDAAMNRVLVTLDGSVDPLALEEACQRGASERPPSMQWWSPDSVSEVFHSRSGQYVVLLDPRYSPPVLARITGNRITPFVEIGRFDDGTRAFPVPKHFLFSSDDSLLIAASDASILVYQTTTGRLLQQIHHSRSPITIVADEGKEYLYCGGLDRGVKRLRWVGNQFEVDKIYRYSAPWSVISYSSNSALRISSHIEDNTPFAFVGRYLITDESSNERNYFVARDLLHDELEVKWKLEFNAQGTYAAVVNDRGLAWMEEEEVCVIPIGEQKVRRLKNLVPEHIFLQLHGIDVSGRYLLLSQGNLIYVVAIDPDAPLPVPPAKPVRPQTAALRNHDDDSRAPGDDVHSLFSPVQSSLNGASRGDRIRIDERTLPPKRRPIEQKARIYDLTQGKRAHSGQALMSGIGCSAASADGSLIAVVIPENIGRTGIGGRGGEIIHIFETNRFERQSQIVTELTQLACLYFYSKDSRLLAVSRQGDMAIYDTASGKAVDHQAFGKTVLSHALLRQPRRVVLMTQDSVEIIPLESGGTKHSFPLKTIAATRSHSLLHDVRNNRLLTSENRGERLRPIVHEMDLAGGQIRFLEEWPFIIPGGAPVSDDGALIVAREGDAHSFFRVQNRKLAKVDFEAPIDGLSPEDRLRRRLGGQLGSHLAATPAAANPIHVHSLWKETEVRFVGISKDNQYALMSGSGNLPNDRDMIHVVDIDSGLRVDALAAEKGYRFTNVLDIANDRIATVDFEGTVHCWKAWWNEGTASRDVEP